MLPSMSFVRPSGPLGKSMDGAVTISSGSVFPRHLPGNDKTPEIQWIPGVFPCARRGT